MTNYDPNVDYDFPDELVVKPRVLVGVTGLDIVNNASHKAIWEGMRGRSTRNDVPLQFKLLSFHEGPDGPYDFPRQKPKKMSYEFHIPKGILKKNWMKKHLTQVPALVVIYYDLDWDDPLWEEKKMECVSRVQSVRLALEGRNTRVCVVLIQKNPPDPSGGDVLALERANALFIAAELHDQCLLILPQIDNIVGFRNKLEEAFFNISLKYYEYKINQIKGHKINLIKKNHHYLFVRYDFKIGFFFEQIQDLKSAFQNYEEAYRSLLEMPHFDTNEFEIKTIAGFINYKICRVLFFMNDTKKSDPFSKFKAHIDHYKLKIGPVLLQFQHQAWLSNQFAMFAKLFAEAIYEKIAGATQTRNPGYYYKSAAKHAELRKMWAYQLCANFHQYPEPDPLSGWENLTFFGQRPWRPCKLSAEPLDPDLEYKGNLALQHVEINKVIHSEIIIKHLGDAISLYKNYNCLRMRNFLAVQMANEYYISKNYGKALTLLMHALALYTTEQWYTIVDKLMVTAMSCAYLTARVCEYVALCLESMSRLNHEESLRSFKNLVAVITGGIPEPEPGLPSNEKETAVELWKTAKADGPVLVKMFTSLIQCKAKIYKQEYNLIEIKISIRSNLPEKFVFSKLTIELKSPTITVVHDVVDGADLFFSAGELKHFSINIEPQYQDIGKLIQINGIYLHVGSIEGRSITLKFNGYGPVSAVCPEFLFSRNVQHPETSFQQLEPILSAIIKNREAKIKAEVVHGSPAMLNEWYPVRLKIENEEDHEINDATITVSFPSSIDKEAHLQTQFSYGDITQLLPASFVLEPFEKFTEKCFYIKCENLTTRIIFIKLSYTINNYTCVVESNIKFPVIDCMVYNGLFMSNKMERLEEVYNREKFIAKSQITSVTRWPITIHSCSMSFNEKFDGSYKNNLAGLTLNPHHSLTDVAHVSTLIESIEPIEIAKFTISWSRQGETKFTTETYNFPKTSVNDLPLTVDVIAPAIGMLRKLYKAVYRINNHSDKLYSLEANVERVEYFIFAGSKKFQIFIQPRSSQEFEYLMYPLLCCGPVQLPMLKLTPVHDKIPTLDQVVKRAFPNSIFIMPSEDQNKNLPICESEIVTVEECRDIQIKHFGTDVPYT